MYVYMYINIVSFFSRNVIYIYYINIYIYIKVNKYTYIYKLI